MTQYWFRPKRYGYGCTPTNWQGWVATLGAAAVVIVSIVLMERFVDRSNFTAWMAWAMALAIGVLWFVRLCRARTEGEWRWRWGAKG